MLCKENEQPTNNERLAMFSAFMVEAYEARTKALKFKKEGDIVSFLEMMSQVHVLGNCATELSDVLFSEQVKLPN